MAFWGKLQESPLSKKLLAGIVLLSGVGTVANNHAKDKADTVLNAEIRASNLSPEAKENLKKATDEVSQQSFDLGLAGGAGILATGAILFGSAISADDRRKKIAQRAESNEIQSPTR